jgi:threonine aldolase
MLAEGPQRIRAVTHLDVSADRIDQAVGIIKRVLQR